MRNKTLENIEKKGSVIKTKISQVSGNFVRRTNEFVDTSVHSENKLKMNETRNKKDKNMHQHIQVFVRIRPTNNAEKASKSPVVVEASSTKEIVVHERLQDKLTKKFTFDKVFGPTSKQLDVYNAVVSPLLEEVLAGYNCTVFAYGQTGTGKTFTMEGTCNDPSLHWQCDSTAGIIPRTLSHLFDELRTLGAQEYSVRVSFLELYNEELFDLLSPTDETSKIRIYEDATRKGAIIIHGLEEVTVHNKSEVYKILEKGSEKRQTAATLMNAHSSRSHTVFSITVHIKENTVDGEELLKTGKLNLVDLAGSENVGRSGAVDRRAREAGNINQSLLTLGRVITALVERAPHVPYRESKLTRLLQESLGGRTKTSIIATISPANMNIEETLSTLDYAHRAKNITNRPEINQKLSKKALLKEYTEEIERLRRDLLATRERNGVYLAQENYNEMQALIEVQSKEIEEKINHIKAFEEAMQNKEKIFSELQMEYESTTNNLHQTKEKLELTKTDLFNTKNKLSETAYDRDLQKHLVIKHVVTEKTLLNQAKTLLNVAEVAANDTQKLHEKINRKQKVEEENENLGQQFRQEMLQRFQHIEEDLNIYAQEIINFCSSFKNQINCAATHQNNGIDTAIKQISHDLTKQEIVISEKLTGNVHKSYDEYHAWILTQIEKASDMTEHEHQALENIIVKICPKIRELVDNKISENLRIFHKETSLKLQNIVNVMKTSVDDFCNNLLVDRDNLTKQVEEIKGMVEITLKNQNQITQNSHKFSKMFSDLKSQFESTWKQYEDFTIENSQSQSVISNKLNEIHIKSNNINQTNLSNFNKNIEQEKLIKKQTETQVDVITKDLSSVLEQNWNIAENAMAKSVDVVNQLEEDLNTCRDDLTFYNNIVKRNAKELQDKTAKHKEAILFNVEEYHKMISDTSTNHTHFLEKQRDVAHSNYSEMNFNLERHAVGSSEQKNKIINGLHSTHGKVETFLSEELRRDIPTGSTPARKDFSFPRNLVATSPHERIIKRFRDTQRNVEFSEDEDNTLTHGNSTLTDILSPCMNGRDSNNSSPVSSKNHVKCSTPYSESKIKKPILYNYIHSNSHNLIKSASTSDIPHTTKNQLDSTCTSESGVVKRREDKENGDEEFVKPSKLIPTRLSKVKSANRKALGSFN